MPRSSRHKSSKHSTRDGKEYSDSERKGKEGGGGGGGSRHSKDLLSGEKRKLDSRSNDVSKEYIDDEYGSSGLLPSSRKHKERVDDDRWTGGGGYDIQLELSKSEMKEKEKEVVRGLGDSKRSSRREYVSGFDVEEVKKSGSKGESKHHRSERKERGEKGGDSERERKGSRSDRSEKLVDIITVNENTRSESNRKQGGSGGKHSVGTIGKEIGEKLVDIVSVSENMGSEERGGKRNVGNTDFNLQEEYKNPEPERDLDRSSRRKRDSSGVGDRHTDAIRDSDDRRLSSREEIPKSGRYKDAVFKEERNGDRSTEGIDRDVWRQDENQRDYRSSRDRTNGKSDDKHLRFDNDIDISIKKSVPHGGEYDRDSDRDRGRDRDRVRGCERDRSRFDHDRDRVHHDRDRDRDLQHVHDQDKDQDLEPVNVRDPELGQDRDRHHDRYSRELKDRFGVRDHVYGRQRNSDHDSKYGLHTDEEGFEYKDDRGRRRSSDGHDYPSDKLRKVNAEIDKGKSLSHKPSVDSITSSGRHRASPSSRTYATADKYRDDIQDESKYGDSVRDVTTPEAVEEVTKYRPGEKRAKLDDNHFGDSSQRSPNTKASPAGVKERSPSMSFDRSRFSNRTTRRQSLDVDDADRKSSGSNNARDMSVTEDRQGFPSKKFPGDEYPSVESPFYHRNRSGQGNFSSHGPGPSPSPGPSGFRTRADSPSFVGSFGEDNRGPGNRHRRSVDPNVGRGPGTPWNGVPNWPPPLSNGFMAFPPGPPGPHHGGFPPIVPQYPPYGIRPYHLPDGDRFPVHMRPTGWPNLADGSMPPHFHGWDTGNGMLRDDSFMYGPGSGHLAQRRDVTSDIWKQNGDMHMDVVSGPQKDGPDEASSAQGGGSKPNFESSYLDDQATSFKKDVSSGLSPMKDSLLTPTKGSTDKTPDSSGVDDTARLLRAYLGKLDISMDLVDPELYNRCISLIVMGETENVEDEVELEYMEGKAVIESEITMSTVDMKFFPAAKESIFQRAMSLYKTQSCERCSVMPDGGMIYGPSPPHPDVELKDNIEFVPTTLEAEMEEAASMSVGEVPNGGHLQNSDADYETKMHVLDSKKIEEETSLPLAPQKLDKTDSFVDITVPAPVTLTGVDDIGIHHGNIVDSDSGHGEQMDVAVSAPLIVCNDSVKALISVSNVSESVVLSRIHGAPESTH